MSRLILIIVFLSLALILGMGQVLPKYQELKFLEQRIEEKRMEIQGKEKYFQELNQMAEALKNYQSQLAKIDSALPPEPGLEVVLDFLQKTSSRSGLILKEVKPSVTRALAKREDESLDSSTIRAPSDLEGIKQSELSLKVSGAYSSFKNFLSVLEQTSRLIEIESISFAAPKEGLPDFHLKIKIYSY